MSYTDLASQASYDSDIVFSGKSGLGKNMFKEKCLEEFHDLTTEKLLEIYLQFIKKSPRVVYEYLTSVSEESDLKVSDLYGEKKIEVITDF